MSILSSLRSRIFLTNALLVVLSIGAAIFLVSVRVTGEFENALQREIVAAGAMVEQLRATRTDSFTTMARLIADAPRLKAAVDTNDPPTVQNLVTVYQNQLQSNLLLVTNAKGQALATLGAPPLDAAVVSSHPAVKAAIEGRESISLLAQPDGVLQLVTVPIAVGLADPDILGTLSVGFRLDDELAGQLKEITGSEIAFGVNGRIVAATLGDEARPYLEDVLGQAGRSVNVTLGAEEYVALFQSLPGDFPGGPAGASPVALILQSRTEHVRFLRAIHRELVVIGIVAVLLATLLGFTVARTITRPLAAITDVMREVAATGDLTHKIALKGDRRWHDEDARLLAATFNTLTDSIARVQRELSQRERLSSLGRLSTVIAHEIRNPLMIIKAALHTIRQPRVSAAALAEAASDIRGEVERLNRIVNEVLDFARPIQFELAPTDLNALCRESAAAAQATPGAAVRLDLDSSVPLVTVDAERLRLALVNLIVNARDAVEARQAAMGEGSVRSLDARRQTRGAVATAAAAPAVDGFVCLSTRARDGRAVISINDTGIGIDAADLSRVFEPYFTTKRGGTGLGLPIAKNVVEGLGGSISATSGVDRGTEIRIEFRYPPTDHATQAS
jgi:signal transduction histidine kinase